MASRRSQRSRSSATSSSAKPTQPSIKRGLESITEGNEAYISKMLSTDGGLTSSCLVTKLEECMRMNNLSAEMLLARFFDESVLSKYSIETLKKSGKGSTATLAARIAKEWSKPTFMSSSSSPPSSKKRKIEDVDDSADQQNDESVDNDWRKPLFYWKGKLKLNRSTNSFSWEGSWSSGIAEDGIPESKKFELTKQNSSFQLEGKLIGSSVESRDEERIAIARGLDALIVGNKWQLKGYYLLDQQDGGGPRKYRDKTHQVAFVKSSEHAVLSNELEGEDRKEQCVLAGACGTTEFGNFISCGFAKKAIDDPKDDAIIFILARRYIDENDERNSWIRKGPNLVADELLKLLCSDDDPFCRDSQCWSKLLPRTKNGK